MQNSRSRPPQTIITAPFPRQAPCRVAVGQMTAVGDQLANFETCKRLAQEAAGKGCRMLFLPECFSFIGTSQQEASDTEALELIVCGPCSSRLTGQQARRTDLSPIM